jgi:hypothetical protein
MAKYVPSTKVDLDTERTACSRCSNSNEGVHSYVADSDMRQSCVADVAACDAC